MTNIIRSVALTQAHLYEKKIPEDKWVDEFLLTGSVQVSGQWIRDVVKLLEEDLSPNWVPVSERLPKFEKREIPISWGDEIDLGAHYQGKWCFFSGAWKPYPNQNVTAWYDLPLPPPPENE